jgi:hypothetical protein
LGAVAERVKDSAVIRGQDSRIPSRMGMGTRGRIITGGCGLTAAE